MKPYKVISYIMVVIVIAVLILFLKESNKNKAIKSMQIDYILQIDGDVVTILYEECHKEVIRLEDLEEFIIKENL